MDGSPLAIVTLLATALTSGWLGSVLVKWIEGRTARSTALTTASLGREGQLDDLTIDLIAAAKKDIKELRDELAILRPMQTHLLHFEEAIYHLETVVTAETDQDRRVAGDAARAFLRRIDRARQAVGNIRQEAQILQAAERVAQNRARDRTIDEFEGEPE